MTLAASLIGQRDADAGEVVFDPVLQFGLIHRVTVEHSEADGGLAGELDGYLVFGMTSTLLHKRKSVHQTGCTPPSGDCSK